MRRIAFLLLVFVVGCEVSAPPYPWRPLSKAAQPVVEALSPAVLGRLTAAQYRNVVTDLFGPDVPDTPLEADTKPYLFTTIGTTTTTVSALGAHRYADSARKIVDWLFADPARLQEQLGCQPATPADPCVVQAIQSIGERLFRRPLNPVELARWTALAQDATAPQPDAKAGLATALYGMLQSPNFLYRIQLGEGDPEDPTRLRYTAFEMAERLSFLFWNTGPDQALLDAAKSGALLTDAGIDAQSRRLLNDPRARRAIQDFFAQYLNLDRLKKVKRPKGEYPLYSDTLKDSMRTEVELLVDDLVFRSKADITTLYSTRRTYVNKELAALYGVEAKGATPTTFVPVELPADGPRAGLLTLGAFLMGNAHGTETSPTLRGKFVRERILCQKVKPPPANLILSSNTDGTPRTLRERMELHRSDPVCAGCHQFMDPPGMLFEGFDPIGAFRLQDRNGFVLDTSGGLDDIPLVGGKDLGAVLEHDPRVPACMVQQLYRHANGRLNDEGEAHILTELTEAFAQSGYRFQELMVALTLSRGFRTLSTERAAAAETPSATETTP